MTFNKTEPMVNGHECCNAETTKKQIHLKQFFNIRSLILYLKFHNRYTYMLKCVLNRSIYSSKPFIKLYIARSSSIDQRSVRVWFVHWSRNAKCVVERVLALCEHLSMCSCSAYKPYNQLLFIVSRVLHSFLLFLVSYTE